MIVRHLAEHRHRRDDDLLCRLRPAHRHQKHRFGTDKLTLTAVGGAISAWSAPALRPGPIGLLMLGSRALFIPGIIVIALGLTLEAGAAGAVKAVKMSAKLLPAARRTTGDQVLPGDASHREAG